MNLSVQETCGDVLVVSQFTLHAGTRKGNRPSYIRAARPETAIPLYEGFIRILETELGKAVPKACLLHEETFRPADKPRKLRMARHYYDLWCLLRAGIGDRALAQMELFQRVAEHRELFFNLSWVDYSTHKQGNFRLTPPADHLANWQAEYEAMLGPVFFGDTPSFKEMMAAAAEFGKTFNATA